MEASQKGRDRVIAKIGRAEAGSEMAIRCWRSASKELDRTVQTNGYGIIADPGELRSLLHEAQSWILESLKAMDSVEWPSDDDYRRVD